MEMGRIDSVMDMTLAVIGAHQVGGLHDAGSDRLAMGGHAWVCRSSSSRAHATRSPCPRAISAGAVPNRTLNFHNQNMTTMRTNVEENVAIATLHCREAKRSARRGNRSAAARRGVIDPTDPQDFLRSRSERSAVRYAQSRAYAGYPGD
jgi:uncharacterized protein (UPF0261 family)